MLDLALLRSFSAIYRTGSLTQAAKALRMTQPSLSNHLRALEEQLGRPLFHRHARGVIATPSADELMARVAPHLDALQASGEELCAPEVGAAGVVHVGSAVDALSERVLGALAAYGEQAESVRFVFHTDTSERLLQSLAQGDLDLVITRDASAPGIEYDVLAAEELVLVVGARRWPSLAALRDEATRLRGLVSGPFVATDREMKVIRETFRHHVGVEIAAWPQMVLPDARAVAAAVAAGRGVAVLPSLCAEPMLARRELFAVAAHGPPAQPPLRIATRPNARNAVRVAGVRRALASAARSWSDETTTRRAG